MTSAWLMGGLFRGIETLAYASPTILCGLLIAGIFQRILGPQGTKRLFGGEGWRSLVVAWLMGMLLPVCSIGVIPVVRELKRAGLSGGAVLAFALSAPLFNPLSILYGMTLSSPLVIFSFALISLAIVTVIGLVWGWMFPITHAVTSPTEPIPYGWRRMLAMLLVGLREIAGASGAYTMIAVAGVMGLSLALPAGILQKTMFHGDASAPLLMAAVAMPAYVTPTTVMSQLGLMFDHGNSVGAALVLLVMGAGVNLGLIAWVTKNYGFKPTLTWLVLFFGTVLGLAYAIEYPLFQSGQDIADHTHAFDNFSAPWPWQDSSGSLKTFMDKLNRDVGRHEWQSLIVIGGMLVVGAVLYGIDPKKRLEAWLQTSPAKPEARATDRYDFVLPGWAIGIVSLLGVIAFSIVACYLYYDHPAATLETIKIYKTGAMYAALHDQEEVCERNILIWDDLTRRLEIGHWIRGGNVSKQTSEDLEQLRHLLDELRHAAEDRDLDEIKEAIRKIESQHAKIVVAFQPKA